MIVYVFLFEKDWRMILVKKYDFEEYALSGLLLPFMKTAVVEKDWVQV